MGLSEIFVGDISYFCTEVDLLRKFEGFGPIQNVIIKRDSSGNSLLYGFVHFSSVSSAKKAVHVVNGQNFMGRNIIVHDTSTRAPKKDYANWFKINVYFCSFVELRISEEYLQGVFNSFGIVQDIVIRDHSVHSIADGVGWVSGYGVVFFAEETTAIHAVELMDNQKAFETHFTCTFRGRVSKAQQIEQGPPHFDSSDGEMEGKVGNMSLLQRRWLAHADQGPPHIRDALRASILNSTSSSSRSVVMSSFFHDSGSSPFPSTQGGGRLERDMRKPFDPSQQGKFLRSPLMYSSIPHYPLDMQRHPSVLQRDHRMNFRNSSNPPQANVFPPGYGEIPARGNFARSVPTYELEAQRENHRKFQGFAADVNFSQYSQSPNTGHMNISTKHEHFQSRNEVDDNSPFHVQSVNARNPYSPREGNRTFNYSAISGGNSPLRIGSVGFQSNEIRQNHTNSSSMSYPPSHLDRQLLPDEIYPHSRSHVISSLQRDQASHELPSFSNSTAYNHRYSSIDQHHFPYTSQSPYETASKFLDNSK